MSAFVDSARALEALGIACFESVDPTGERLIDAGPRLAELVGRPLEALLGGEPAESWRRSVEDEDWPVVEQVIGVATDEGRAYEVEYRLRRVDGKSRRLRERGKVVDGTLRAIVIDVTDLSVTQVWTTGADVWFRAMVENANDALFVLDDGVFVDCNPSAERLFGAPRRAIVGQGPGDFSPEEQPDGRRSAEALVGILADAYEGRPVRFEWEHERPSGQRFLSEVSLNQVPAAGSRCLVAIVRDVTNRRRVEEALRRNEALFRTAFQSAGFATTIVDFDGRYIDVNDAFVRWAGLPRESIEGRTAVELGFFTQEQQDTLLEQVFSEGHVWDVELTVRAVDGTERFILYSISPVTIQGHVHYLGTTVDVTQQKLAAKVLREANEVLERRVEERTAELEQRNAELARAMNQLVHSEKLAGLGSVVAGVAHELNTPIGNARTVASSLVGVVQAFEKRLAAGEPLRKSSLVELLAQCRDAAAILEKNTARAHDLIHGFKQVAVDQTSMRRRPYDLKETIDEVLATLGHQLRRARVRVENDVEAGLVMDGYPGPLQQILTNFVTNSLRHGFEGREQGTIAISAVRRIDRIVLRYVDDGAGMSSTQVKRAFEPFFTTKLGQGGSGLGLYIAYNLVHAVLGGTIRLASEPGRGVSFELELPVVAPVVRDEDAGNVV
ncbi:MAG: PAS domain S-box protein [Polyangiales bacterium]